MCCRAKLVSEFLIPSRGSVLINETFCTAFPHPPAPAVVREGRGKLHTKEKVRENYDAQKNKVFHGDLGRYAKEDCAH